VASRKVISVLKHGGGKTSLASTARCLKETLVDMMKKSICKYLLKVMPRVTEFTDLRSAYIANCVINNFLAYTAIMLNIVTIHAIRKASSLSKTLKTLLLSLAVSDLGVGLLGQPV